MELLAGRSDGVCDRIGRIRIHHTLHSVGRDRKTRKLATNRWRQTCGRGHPNWQTERIPIVLTGHRRLDTANPAYADLSGVSLHPISPTVDMVPERGFEPRTY